MQKINNITNEFLNKKLPDIKVGDTVKVHQKIPARSASPSDAGGKEGDKQRVQVFEGLVLANKHGKGIEGTITVRRIISGIGVEKTFPLHSPLIEKIEIVSRGKVRRAKLYYLRERIGKKAKIKRREYTPGEEIIEKAEEPKQAEEKPEELQKTEEQPQPEQKKETKE